MKKCYNCREEHKNKDMLCDDCAQFGIHQFPGTTGLSDGPSSGVNEMVFDRPDARKDCAITAKRLEESGALARNPKLRKYVDIKMKSLETKQYNSVDYQKTGHPLDSGGGMAGLSG